MAETCAHGLPAAECLICRTLGTGSAGPTGMAGSGAAGGGQGSQAVGTRHRSRWRGGHPGNASNGGAGSPAVQPDAVFPTGTKPPSRSGRGGLSLGGLILALIAIGAVIWVVFSVVFSLLHVIELAVVALIAGWIGFRVGHYRGRHVKQ